MRRILVILCLFLMPAGATGAEPAIGRIVRLQGDVQVLRHDRPTALAEGASLQVGDILRTGRNGKAELAGTGGLIVTIGEGSEVEVARYLAAAGGGHLDVVVRLFSGIVRLIGEPAAGMRRIDVETRTAVASVRSTDWLVERTEKGTGVFVREGGVEVTGISGGVTVLAPGEGTDVAFGARPTPAKAWGQARRDRALAATSF